MDQETINRIIDCIYWDLSNKGININGIYLFGSRANGMATEESDFDIAIVSESFNDKDYFERASMIYPANFRKEYPIDLILLSEEEWLENKGITTYDIHETGILYQPTI